MNSAAGPSDNNKHRLPRRFNTVPTPKNFLPIIRESAKETMTTRRESGFSVGLVQLPGGDYEARFYGSMHSPDRAYEERIQRPPLEERALMHFHTHVPDDNARGLSISDVLLPAFQKGFTTFL